LTLEDIENLESLVEAGEKDTEDPDAALATLAGLVGRRIAMRQAQTTKVEADHDEGRDEGPSPVKSPGGAMSSHPAPPKVRRPFAGYDREIEAYEQLRPQPLDRAEGLYVALVGDEMIGPFRRHSEAEEAGYARFGLGPLFIKRVLAEEPVIEVTRFGAT
jgi:hypothetical protein